MSEIPLVVSQTLTKDWQVDLAGRPNIDSGKQGEIHNLI